MSQASPKRGEIASLRKKSSLSCKLTQFQWEQSSLSRVAEHRQATAVLVHRDRAPITIDWGWGGVFSAEKAQSRRRSLSFSHSLSPVPLPEAIQLLITLPPSLSTYILFSSNLVLFSIAIGCHTSTIKISQRWSADHSFLPQKPKGVFHVNAIIGLHYFTLKRAVFITVM